MRFQKKRLQPTYHLAQSHLNPPANAHEAETRWQSFKYKAPLSNKLFDEQYGLCAYTELRLDEGESGDHIEHVKPKSHFPKNTFDYQNLVLCALSSDALKAMSKEDVFGGHAKRSKYDARFLSCLQHDCARYFSYLSDGRVVPAMSLDAVETQKADYTINNILNLNCAYLKNRRRKWLVEIETLIDDHLDDLEILSIIAGIELDSTNGKLREFHSAVRQSFGAFGEEYIRDNCPELL